MKLESLKNDKFEAFKKNELQNAFQIVGGVKKDTRYGAEQGGGCDTIDRSTDNTGTTDGNGDPVDFHRFKCADEENTNLS